MTTANDFLTQALSHQVTPGLSACHRIIAEKYYQFMQTLRQGEENLMQGALEDKFKLLTSLYSNCLEGSLKHQLAHYASETALKLAEEYHTDGLVIDQVVPKEIFFEALLRQEPTETVESLHDLLDNYYVTALITREEERCLPQGLPAEAFEADIFARYRERVELEMNPHFQIDPKAILPHLQ